MAETITIRIETERLVLQETPGFLRVMATKRCNIDRLALDKNGSIMPDLVIAQQYTKRFQDRMDQFDT
jgi:hypothetical protein